jgi:hypothetical protein
MQFLGTLRGTGVLASGEETIGPADYDLDGYLQQGEVIASGELRMAAEGLSKAFGLRDLRLLTEDGRQLHLRFSAKLLDPDTDAAHVDVQTGLPPAEQWRH